MKLSELDTPALIADLDLLEQNLAAMQMHADALGLRLRPHTKAHKIPALARMQLEHGAAGICVAKLGEAEVMARGGIEDILITTPIAGDIKYRRLIQLIRDYPQCRFTQVIDNPAQVSPLATLATAAKVEVALMIEVESGQARCGVAVGDALKELIVQINAVPALRFAGIQAYSGHLQHIKGFAERTRAARDAVAPLFDYIERELKPLGLAPTVVSGAGTGTFAACEGLGFTEIQAGSYLFMDSSYRQIGDERGDSFETFHTALKVWTTVISTPTPNRAVVDAGSKCLSTDMGPAQPEGRSDLSYRSGGDEHGILTLSDGCAPLALGEQLMMIPSHCDTTLNNFSTLYGVRGDEVVCSWIIEGRGRSD
ncbi:DSD1 family PLP-dependent enzyme [Shewanella sp. JM162201]|uniref:DSD1 family PLP-dependent enzyme n=1 Tax=Shewanella jiangmenensis TaxID=2837387 RepID=A0ABS5V543_9GAMM|nr:DSD1 family PLP-dependent enzyme [Shewanella jiangmenensis]MBT1445073.1 DSD1 family PLP-dependent enzyme [Shewanella jiangmenensis]